MGGEKAAGVDEDTALGPGVEDLLPVEGPPILYDCDMAVRAKKDVAAANMVDNKQQRPRHGYFYICECLASRPPDFCPFKNASASTMRRMAGGTRAFVATFFEPLDLIHD